MEFLIAIVASILFVFVCRNAIKAHPAIFYLAAALISVAFVSHVFTSIAPTFDRALFPYVQRCLLAFGLFAVVMYLGVLPEDSKLKGWLAPIRGELSIIAAILACGHIINYLSSYLTQLLAGFAGMKPTMIASFSVSFALMVLLILLSVTSIRAIKKRMNVLSWKRIQLLAYPFFFLIYFHLVLILAPSVSGPEQRAFSSIVVYTVIIVGYLVLRLRRKWLDDHTVLNENSLNKAARCG